MIYSLALMKQQDFSNTITRACYSKTLYNLPTTGLSEGWVKDGNEQFGNRASCHSALSKSTDCKKLDGLVQCRISSSTSACQHLGTGSQQFCISHCLSFRSKSLSRLAGALLPVILIPRVLWFSANFAYTAVFRNSSSVFTRVSQWSLLTTVERHNIIMF